VTGPGTGKEGGEKSDQAEDKERRDNVRHERKDGVDKSNTKERKESERSRDKEPDKERKEKAKDDDRSREKEKDRKPENPKGKAYDDSNRVEREGPSPYELPKSVRPEQGSGGLSSQHGETKPIDFPKGKDPKTQMEEARKKQAEDAERTRQEQRRLMSRLR